MSRVNHQSWRGRCINLGAKAESSDSEYIVFNSIEDCRILRDLEDMLYVDGSTTFNEHGEVIDFRLRCFTLRGLIFLEELQASIDSEVWYRRLIPYIPIFIGWLLGLITLLIGSLFK